MGKIKLSDAQKDIIKFMQAGNKIFISDGFKIKTVPMGRYVKIRDSTVDALEKIGILDGLTLTALGKSIDLK